MKYLWVALCMAIFASAASADEAMRTRASTYGYQDTQARLEAVLKENGLTVFAKIDHAKGAQEAGLNMSPATVTIFGNPKGGTPFMVASPESAIDFPLKALVWEDAAGKVFISYSTVTSIVDRHNIKGLDEMAKKLDGLLAAITNAAAE